MLAAATEPAALGAGLVLVLLEGLLPFPFPFVDPDPSCAVARTGVGDNGIGGTGGGTFGDPRPSLSRSLSRRRWDDEDGAGELERECGVGVVLGEGGVRFEEDVLLVLLLEAVVKEGMDARACVGRGLRGVGERGGR